MNSNTKKTLLIGGLSIAGLATAYFWYRDKQNRRPVGIIDDQDVDFDYENAIGKLNSDKVREGIEISINEYKKSLEQTLNDKKYAKYLGQKIYTLTDNVNVRMGAGVNNGIINNIAGTIPYKKSFIGKVVTAKLGDDKKIWFAVNEENSNQLYEIKKNFSWDIMKKNDPSLRWFRSDVVVINMNKKK
jgi:hypothetical protein